MFKFQTLKVWEKAIEYVDLLMSVADSFPQKYQFSLGEQLRRASLSVTNNIAEGSGRKTKKDSQLFYNFSKGSVYETISILTVASRRGLISLNLQERQNLYNRAEEICKMLSGLMR